jgi:hypothetical protein
MTNYNFQIALGFVSLSLATACGPSFCFKVCCSELEKCVMMDRWMLKVHVT